MLTLSKMIFLPLFEEVDVMTSRRKTRGNLMINCGKKKMSSLADKIDFII